MTRTSLSHVHRVGVAVMSHDDVFAHNFQDKRQPQLNFFSVNNRTLVDNIHTSVLLRSTTSAYVCGTQEVPRGKRAHGPEVLK